ncbi:MAG: hypothetical protein ACXW30_03145 [Micavibrio sp.]
MSFSVPDSAKEKIKILVVMVVIFVAVGVGNLLFKLPDPEPLQIDKGGLQTLEGKGGLPSLHDAVAADATLGEMVKKLDEVPAPQLFIQQTDIDLNIVNILFRWSGADMAQANEYGPYIDARVVSFLKKIGSVPETTLPGKEIEMVEAGSLNQLWFKVFEHFRTRLLIQTSGKGVYGGNAKYDLATDKIVISGPISPDFIQEFEAALKVSDNSGEAMRAFLDFIDATKGFSALSDAEQDMIMSLEVVQPNAEPVAEVPATPETQSAPSP